MQNLRNKLIAGSAVLILAAIGTVMNRQAARADVTGPTVAIGAPLPLPVTGTVAVTGNVATTGTVAATQSGPWNVSITGTPNVTVANPATAPVFNINVSDKGRVAYQNQTNSFSCVASDNGNTCPATGVVPTGHRLVIEHFFAGTPVTPFSTGAQVFLYATTGKPFGPVASAFPANLLVLPFNAPPSLVVDQPVLIYLDPGQQLRFSLFVANGAQSLTFQNLASSVTGYMLDCTIAPCAAIAQ
jgi:hypothetical protein